MIQIKDAVTRLPEVRFDLPVNWTIDKGEQWAVIGPNGAGKTILSEMLQRKYALQTGEISCDFAGKSNELIRSITFKDIYSLADCRNSYYQQRWNATETEEMPTVEDLLKDFKGQDDLQEMLSLFGVEESLPKKIIFLSSGELRKFLIVRTLLFHPRLIILDNPFIGLDAPSRDLLNSMLQKMSQLKGTQIVLLLSNPNDIPEMITHVLPVENKSLLPVMSREAFLNDQKLQDRLFPQPTGEINLPEEALPKTSQHEVTLRMENIHIKYGTRTILKDLNWEIRNGEKWALLGPNGSGKSTLLSLVYADNPQSYANTLYLFDRKRGTGESIWEIKSRIGYVSPEMHLFYKENVPAINVVASGFFDSIGLYRKCNDQQKETALTWMKVFSISELKDRPFLTLSSGEQRLVLLARAFVKNPDLIILDEPLHGLDAYNKRQAARIIDKFCQRKGKTLIYVTHYPQELPACVNNKFVLKKII